jgi:prepilin-type N-terminal cleavage/methylation domain-containing protein
MEKQAVMGTMQISKTGTWGRRQSGFTLIELIVVIIILGMVSLLVFPRLRAFQAGEMKRAIRHLSIVIHQMTLDSASTKERYRLYFNLDSNDYWAVSVQESVRESDRVILLTEKPMIKRKPLPAGIEFEDIVTAQHGKVTQGEVFSEFYPVGIEALTLHLKEGDDHWTLVADPLTGRVKTFDRYLD